MVVRSKAGILKPKLGMDECFLGLVSIEICRSPLESSYFSVLSSKSLAGAFPFEAQRLPWRPDILEWLVVVY